MHVSHFYFPLKALLLALLLTGCAATLQPNSHLMFVSLPEITDLESVPLAKRIKLETSEATRLNIRLTSVDHSFVIKFEESSRRHDELLLGLYSGQSYDVTVILEDESGGELVWKPESSLVTIPVPDGFPVIQRQNYHPEKKEPGYYTLSISSFAGLEKTSQVYTAIIDSHGEPVWYQEQSAHTMFLQRGPDNIYFLVADYFASEQQRIVKTGLDGVVTQELNIAQLAENPKMPYLSSESDSRKLSVFHHDLQMIGDPGQSNPHFLVPMFSNRKVEDFPVDVSDSEARESQYVIDSPIVELDLDGEIFNVWHFLDIIKPNRITYSFDLLSWEGIEYGADWSHLNAAFIDENDGNIVASLRNQDAIFKINRESGELMWILGNPDNWEGFEQYLFSIDDDSDWFYHQHTPSFTADGTLLVFDNGNYRNSPFNGNTLAPEETYFSRAIEYKIDEEAMTVEKVWEYTPMATGERIYNAAAGSVYELPHTGNAWVTFSTVCDDKSKGFDLKKGRLCKYSTIIREVTRGETPEVIFELFFTRRPGRSDNFGVYRSMPMESLYTNATIETINSPFEGD